MRMKALGSKIAGRRPRDAAAHRQRSGQHQARLRRRERHGDSRKPLRAASVSLIAISLRLPQRCFDRGPDARDRCRSGRCCRVIATSISASVGFGFAASSAAADMICPDWQ